jgi:hypothetical protein
MQLKFAISEILGAVGAIEHFKVKVKRTLAYTSSLCDRIPASGGWRPKFAVIC